MREHNQYVTMAAEMCNETPQTVLGNTRKRHVSAARWFAYRQAWKDGHSQAEIARMFHKDRTSVAHGLAAQK